MGSTAASFRVLLVSYVLIGPAGDHRGERLLGPLGQEGTCWVSSCRGDVTDSVPLVGCRRWGYVVFAQVTGVPPKGHWSGVMSQDMGDSSVSGHRWQFEWSWW